MMRPQGLPEAHQNTGGSGASLVVPPPGWGTLPDSPHGPGFHHGRRNGLIIGVGVTVLAFATGLVNIQHHDNLGGWTVAVAGYSCWFSPGGDSSKTYCGSDSGFFHLPNPSSGTTATPQQPTGAIQPQATLEPTPDPTPDQQQLAQQQAGAQATQARSDAQTAWSHMADVKGHLNDMLAHPEYGQQVVDDARQQLGDARKAVDWDCGNPVATDYCAAQYGWSATTPWGPIP
jgi:hypothetical protein